MSRMDRFIEALKEYGIASLRTAYDRYVTETDELEMDRYLLVEGNVGPAADEQPCYLTTHKSPQDAATYHLGQEHAQGWCVEYLLDLDTGQCYEVEKTITFTAVPQEVSADGPATG